MNQSSSTWYSCKCIFVSTRDDTACDFTYEERITLWSAIDAYSAIKLAEDEASAYAEENTVKYTGFCTSFQLFDQPIAGKEIYSIIRNSDLDPEQYLDEHYDTGEERAEDFDPNGNLESLLDYETLLLKTLESTRRKIEKLKR